MDDNAEEWLATEDPTEGDLPTTEFIGSTKDLSQSVDPAEDDGSEIADAPERDSAEDDGAVLAEGETPEDSDDEGAVLGAPEEESAE